MTPISPIDASEQPSREGENIAFEVLGVCQAANRRLRVRRARFSALIARDIEHSLRNLVEPNKAESDAVDVRMELDMRIGFAFTRFQTTRWRSKFEIADQEQKEPISYGPCQFPTLGFVVDQYWKHEHFKSEEFFYLSLQVRKDELNCDFSWIRKRLFDRLSCFIIYETLFKNHTTAQVIKVEKNPKRKFRPFPLTTVELQKAMSRKLHISSHDTMAIAERLYQAGYLSYPRTETDRFPANFDFSTLIQQQTASQQWGEYANKLLTGDAFVTPKAGQHDDASHPPIHPTKFVDTLQGADAAIYEFVVRHFLACCSQDALGHETLVEVAVGQELFFARGLAIQAYNFLEVYPYQKWSDENIPNFILGEMVPITKLMMDQGMTTAPPLLTEADLIQLMHQNGIGTDATIAEHIATILARKYVEKKGTRMEFVPTKLGEALVAGYNFIGYRRLNQPQLRAALEADLKRICLRQVTKDIVLAQQVQDYKTFFRDIKTKVGSLDRALALYFPLSGSTIVSERPNFSKCGTCGRLMAHRQGLNETNFLFCATCNQSHRLPGGTLSASLPFSPDSPNRPSNFACPICHFQVIAVTSRLGKEFIVCPSCYANPPPVVKAQIGDLENMPCYKCTFATCPLRGGTVAFDNLPLRSCPSCSSNMIIRQAKNGQFMLACTNYPACSKKLFFPTQYIKDVKPTATACPTCTKRPSFLAEFYYTDQEVFRDGIEKDVSCVMGCTGCRIKPLLDEATGGFAAWELAKAAPAPPRPAAKPTAAGIAKHATAKATRATGSKMTGHQALPKSSAAAKKSAFAKRTSTASGTAAKSTGAYAKPSNAKYPAKPTSSYGSYGAAAHANPPGQVTMHRQPKLAAAASHSNPFLKHK